MRVCCKLWSVSSCSAFEDQNSAFQRKTWCFVSADVCHSLAKGQLFSVPLMILIRPDFFQLVCISLINQNVGKKYMMIYKKYILIYDVVMVWVTEMLVGDLFFLISCLLPYAMGQGYQKLVFQCTLGTGAYTNTVLQLHCA